VRYILSQLCRVSPFDRWPAFDSYGRVYGAPGISAVILDERSQGEARDVRTVEALVIPGGGASEPVVADGFDADTADLTTPRRAASSMLDGRGLLIFLALWSVSGRRPYPRWLSLGILLGWLATAGLIVRLLSGSDPGDNLELVFAILLGLWSLLVMSAIGVACALGFRAWIAGRQWHQRLKENQTRLRINGGISLKGGSAGLAFCVNTLLAAYRSRPRIASHSWLWERFFRKLKSSAHRWAATGAVTSEGKVEHVVLQPKLRASLRHPQIGRILTPWQAEGKQSFVDRMAESLRNTSEKQLRIYRCRHVAQSIMAVGDFTSRSQIATNLLAVAVSIVMLSALPDLRRVLSPARPPSVVSPASPSPYYLWVSLDTERPRDFWVVLESAFWSNRRAEVAAHGGANGSMRAEVRLNRLDQPGSGDEENGTVWIERRRTFLTREFASGERVGSYSFSRVARQGLD